MSVQRGRLKGMSDAEKKAFFLARAKKASDAKYGKAETALAVNPELTEGDQIVQTIAGQPIQRKSWKYIPNKDLEKDLIYDIDNGHNTLLTGPTGSGKTSCIFELAKAKGQKVIRCNLNGQTSFHDLVGTWVLKPNPNGGTVTEFILGILPKAMMEGAWLILDEIDYAQPEILGALNAVLEPGQPLILKEKDGEAIYPIEQFRIFATANSVGSMNEYKRYYQGTNNLNSAFLARFSIYEVNWHTKAQEKKIIQKNYPNIAEGLLDDLVEVASLLRKSFLSHEFDMPCSPREIFDVAKRLSNGFDFNLAIEKVFKARVPNKAQYEIILGIVQRVHLKR